MICTGTQSVRGFVRTCSMDTAVITLRFRAPVYVRVLADFDGFHGKMADGTAPIGPNGGTQARLRFFGRITRNETSLESLSSVVQGPGVQGPGVQGPGVQGPGVQGPGVQGPQ